MFTEKEIKEYYVHINEFLNNLYEYTNMPPGYNICDCKNGKTCIAPQNICISCQHKREDKHE